MAGERQRTQADVKHLLMPSLGTCDWSDPATREHLDPRKLPTYIEHRHLHQGGPRCATRVSYRAACCANSLITSSQLFPTRSSAHKIDFRPRKTPTILVASSRQKRVETCGPRNGVGLTICSYSYTGDAEEGPLTCRVVVASSVDALCATFEHDGISDVMTTIAGTLDGSN